MYEPIAPARTTAPTHACSHARERGFTLLEMIIVGAIILVLLAIGAMSLRGSKEAVKSNEVRAAAAAYSEAFAKYMSDNANIPPTSAVMLKVGGFEAGPRSLASLTKPYLTPIPDGVSSGRIGVSMDGSTGCTGTPPVTGAQKGYIAYCSEPAPGYAIRAVWEAKGTWSECWAGNTARMPSCTKTSNP